MKTFIAGLLALFFLSGCGSPAETKSVIIDDLNTTVIDDNNSTTIDDENATAVDDENSTDIDDNIPCEPVYSDEMMQGRDLYNTHCKVCHASDAHSGMFDIRGSVVADIDRAMQEVPNMVELNLAEQVPSQERTLIALYLVQIKTDPQVEFGNQCDVLSAVTKEALGSRLFFDANLSLRKTISCASCHNPGYGFSDARFQFPDTTNPVEGALSVGDDGVTLGGRNAPTATYAQFTPAFSQNADGEYFGGQFHDGRAATLKEQAKGPFLDQAEMMMPSAEAVVERVIENPQYVADFKALYGEDLFDDKLRAYDALAEAIAYFEKTEVFAPFDSKYDRSRLAASDENAYTMTLQEEQGYVLFFDTNKTNCVLCHTVNAASESANEVFTNFKYENIGTPRNLEALLARDGNTDKIDLGLGGRADINDSLHYGKVRVPTLRNVAVTGPYMSNGVFKELSTVLAFYNHMSGKESTTLNPETNASWVEAEVNATINHPLLEMELLSDEELAALEAFLLLLTDKQYEALINK
jgi:cytochrome c peroxidase